MSVPSFLPESPDAMRRSVAKVVCTRQIEIVSEGKTVAAIREITPDTTFYIVKENADSSTEVHLTLLGCWINKLTFFPSCNGRIMSVNPFAEDCEKLATLNADTLVNRTINHLDEMATKYKRRKAELDYYLKTHSVKDEGYTFIAEYAEEYADLRSKAEKQLELLYKLKNMKNLRLNERTSYALLYSANGKTTITIPCTIVNEDKSGRAQQTVTLQTRNKFMPKEANAVYTSKFFRISPERDDTINAATVFGLYSPGAAKPALRKISTFRGVMKDSCRHDIPQLLLPDGAPLFSDKGFFIGLNFNGRII